MKVWVIVGATLCLATGGCASLDFTPRSKVAQQADMSGYFAERLDVGRAHLAAGRPTKAIEAFRQASYNRALAPDAFNGMAVAYSTLGRDDVARDLFARAADLDPTDQRYWRNLARVDERIMLAGQNSPSDLAPRNSPESVFALSPKDAPVAAVRIARPREVFIRTSPYGQTAGGTAAQRKLDGAILSQGNAVRVAKPKEVFIATSPTERAVEVKILERKLNGAVVRVPINIADLKPRSTYPIRVSLASADQGTAGPRSSVSSAPVRFRFSLLDQ